MYSCIEKVRVNQDGRGWPGAGRGPLLWAICVFVQVFALVREIVVAFLDIGVILWSNGWYWTDHKISIYIGGITMSENTVEKKARLNWVVDDEKMAVNWPGMDNMSTSFYYNEIEGYVQPTCPIVFGLFKHGLKQKLADSVAGATKRGDSFEAQEKTMCDVWEAVKTGKQKERANAAPKISLNDIQNKFAAMPDGPEKEMAKMLLTTMGLLK